MRIHVVPSLAEPVGSLWRKLQEKYTAVGKFRVASPLSSTPPRQVLDADHVVVIASSPKKRDLVKQLLTYDSFTPDFPLSVVHHPGVKDRVSIFLTEDVEWKPHPSR